MDDDDVAKLCENLNLTEEDGPIVEFSHEIQNEGLKDIISHYLVGRVLARKRVNRDAFRRVLTQIWSNIRKVDIELVGENTFLFHFTRLEDRDVVWARGPWHFDGSLIVLEKPKGLGEISKMEFKWVEFWVQICRVPIVCMNRKMARLMAEQIGHVVELPVESKDFWGNFMRVRVAIDITKPLKRGLRLSLDETGNVVNVMLRYERLQRFCYACGRVGHSVRECWDDAARTEVLEGGASAKFGPWLKAPVPDKLDSNEKGERSLRGKKKADDEHGEASTMVLSRGSQVTNLVTRDGESIRLTLERPKEQNTIMMEPKDSRLLESGGSTERNRVCLM